MSARLGKAICAALSLNRFPSVAVETVPVLVWLTMALSLISVSEENNLFTQYMIKHLDFNVASDRPRLKYWYGFRYVSLRFALWNGPNACFIRELISSALGPLALKLKLLLLNTCDNDQLWTSPSLKVCSWGKWKIGLSRIGVKKKKTTTTTTTTTNNSYKIQKKKMKERREERKKKKGKNESLIEKANADDRLLHQHESGENAWSPTDIGA